MNYRTLGKTNLRVSELGFGCGAVGGLLVRGAYPEMLRTVARAIEAGITYFDTARMYGNGQSEVNLGTVLAELKADVIVGTKVHLAASDLGRIEPGIVAAVESSLIRLRRECIDLFQLHNSVASQRQPEQQSVSLSDVEAAMRAFERLHQQGKLRYWGINGLGESAALQQAVALYGGMNGGASGAQTIQCCYNLLNPSAGTAVPAAFPFQDYGQLINQAAAQQMGVIAIRVLAGGALSGSATRHPVAAQQVDPIATSQDLSEDAIRAHVFDFLVKEGITESLVEAAIRFAISHPQVSTALVGISSYEQFEMALKAAEKGPLPGDVLARVIKKE